MSYNKWNATLDTTNGSYSCNRMAMYANHRHGIKENISLYQLVDNLKAGTVSFSDISAIEMLYNDRPIEGGGRGKNAASYGAVFGNSLILQSRGDGTGTLILGTPPGPGVGDFVESLIAITKIEGYSPNYYWNYSTGTTTNTPKTEHPLINGFDTGTVDYLDITTGLTKSNDLLQYLVSTESIGADAAFASPLQYSDEFPAGTPEGFGNCSGADIYSTDDDYAVIFFDFNDKGNGLPIVIRTLIGWTTNVGNNTEIGYKAVGDPVVDSWITTNHAGSISTAGLVSYAITSGGSGYSDGTYAVTISGVGGSGATATYTCSGGAVVSINITAAGSGYSSITLTLDSGGSSNATAIGYLGGSYSLDMNSLTGDEKTALKEGADFEDIMSPQNNTVSGRQEQKQVLSFVVQMTTHES